ncbi:TonB-dependent siderophore receptor [Uliginosibacterium sp. H1]|uniref:TonB-dependent siderophore receptor n=1 Tax=Uliginosibacterium sp. H1 TaxID=3114757 RepID=UPI002E196349|nr:TonB-dependent siderophore receptor [Uliginosibacterium sp. H1]
MYKPLARRALLGIAVGGLTPVHAQNTTTPTTAASEQTLPAVQVRAGAAPAYTAPDAGGATRSDVPLIETPQSVRVLTGPLLQDIGATRVDDALDYSSGISRQNSFGGLWDNVAIRGLAGNENSGMTLLRNGFAGNRGFTAPRDAANVERIEVLKGPAAALYGSSEPGGTLNVVTKKPQFRAAHSLSARAASHDQYRVAVDSTAPITTDLAYRVNAAYEDNGSFRDEVYSKRGLLAPALTLRLGGNTLINYESEFLRHETLLDRGIVAPNGRIDALPRERFLGEPNDGPVTISNQTHELNVEHYLDESWRTRAGLSYRGSELDGYSTEASALQTDGRILRRQRRYRDYSSRDIAVQAEVLGKFATGSLRHELLTGIEGNSFEQDQRMLRINPTAAAPYAIDIYNPVYGRPQPTPLPNTDNHEEQTGAAWYLQDQLAFGPHWRVLAGVRMEQFDQRLENRRTGVVREQTQYATTPRAGVSWLPAPWLSVYANAGMSFRPNTGVDVNNAAFQPEEGVAYETGVKAERDGLSATLAAFRITKQNVLTADPFNPGYSVAAGEVRSQGVELDIAGQLTRQLRVSASYAFTDAKVTEDTTLAGKPLLNVPRHGGSLLGIYEMPAPFGEGRPLGLGAGITYVGTRSGDALDTFKLPDYTTARLLAYWQATSQLRLALDVNNLFDTEYYSSSYNNLWISPGAGRSLSLTATWKM